MDDMGGDINNGGEEIKKNEGRNEGGIEETNWKGSWGSIKMSKSKIESELRKILNKQTINQDSLAIKLSQHNLPIRESYTILRSLIDSNQLPYTKDPSGKYIFLTSF